MRAPPTPRRMRPETARPLVALGALGTGRAPLVCVLTLVLCSTGIPLISALRLLRVLSQDARRHAEELVQRGALSSALMLLAVRDDVEAEEGSSAAPTVRRRAALSRAPPAVDGGNAHEASDGDGGVAVHAATVLRQLQLQALRLWRVCLCYGLGVPEFSELSPLVVTATVDAPLAPASYALLAAMAHVCGEEESAEDAADALRSSGMALASTPDGEEAVRVRDAHPSAAVPAAAHVALSAPAPPHDTAAAQLAVARAAAAVHFLAAYYAVQGNATEQELAEGWAQGRPLRELREVRAMWGSVCVPLLEGALVRWAAQRLREEARAVGGALSLREAGWARACVELLVGVVRLARSLLLRMRREWELDPAALRPAVRALAALAGLPRAAALDAACGALAGGPRVDEVLRRHRQRRVTDLLGQCMALATLVAEALAAATEGGAEEELPMTQATCWRMAAHTGWALLPRLLPGDEALALAAVQHVVGRGMVHEALRMSEPASVRPWPPRARLLGLTACPCGRRRSSKL